MRPPAGGKEACQRRLLLACVWAALVAPLLASPALVPRMLQWTTGAVLKFQPSDKLRLGPDTLTRLQSIGEGGAAQIFTTEVEKKGGTQPKMVAKICWSPVPQVSLDEIKGQCENEIRMLPKVKKAAKWVPPSLDASGTAKIGPFLSPKPHGRLGMTSSVGVPALLFADQARGGTLQSSFVAQSYQAKIGAETRLEILVEVFEALQLLHKEGIFHGDFTPDNILFRSETRGTKVLAGGEMRHTMTIDYAVSDDAEYLEGRPVIAFACRSPEALAWQPGALLHHRVRGKPMDMWSAGVIAWQMALDAVPVDEKRRAEEKAALKAEGKTDAEIKEAMAERFYIMPASLEFQGKDDEDDRIEMMQSWAAESAKWREQTFKNDLHRGRKNKLPESLARLIEGLWRPEDSRFDAEEALEMAKKVTKEDLDFDIKASKKGLF